MPENIIDKIVVELRGSVPALYPHRGELKTIRVVGHTPKADHFVYDVVADFADGNERLAAKVYRPHRSGPAASKHSARVEADNLRSVYSVFEKKKLSGIPRPVGDFSSLGAIVTEKICGLPLQSLIMKAALLSGSEGHELLNKSAGMAGAWLRAFHKATSDMPEKFDAQKLITELEAVCTSCRGAGLDDGAVRTVLHGAKHSLSRAKKTLPVSAVINDFTPLNVVVGERGIGIADYSRMAICGSSLNDVASFVAAVEALEKYPFCNRSLTMRVQEEFLEAYGVTAAERGIIRVLKIKALLAMFAKGRNVRESALRKKIMWANVMKRLIQQAAQRTLSAA